MSTEEVWKDIPGFEGAYQVSDLGRVRSLDRSYSQRNRWGLATNGRRKGKVLSPARGTNGYISYQLGSGVRRLAHRLVATAFLGPPSPGEEVNHRNGIRDDNRLENLEWVTRGDNHRHSYAKLNRKQHAKTTPVVLLKGDEALRFDSQLSAAKFLGRAVGSVRCAFVKGHKCKGYEVRHG